MKYLFLPLLFLCLLTSGQETLITPWGIKDNTLNVWGIMDGSLGMGINVNTINKYLTDGNTVAWYDFTDLTTITKNVNNKVTLIIDKLGSGHNLIQADTAKSPTYTSSDGVSFDGVNDYLKTAGFTYSQPEQIYLLIEKTLQYNGQVFMDGNATSSGLLYNFGASADDSTCIYAGAFSKRSNELKNNTWGIASILFNGANSSYTVNDFSPLINNSGSANMNGITFAVRASETNNWAHMKIREAIFRKGIDSTSTKAAIFAYLKNKLVKNYSFDRAKVVFTFDDYLQTHYDYAYPLFATKGVKGSIAIPTDWMTTPTMWTEMATMKNNGWDIINHTKSHRFLNILTDQQIINECDSSALAYTANGITPPVNFAYPGGTYTVGTPEINILKGYYLSARQYYRNDLYYIYKNVDKYNIVSIAISNNINLSLAEANIDYAIKWKSAIIFITHMIYNNTGETGGIDVSKLSTLIDYCQARNVDIITYSQLVNLLNP